MIEMNEEVKVLPESLVVNSAGRNFVFLFEDTTGFKLWVNPRRGPVCWHPTLDFSGVPGSVIRTLCVGVGC